MASAPNTAGTSAAPASALAAPAIEKKVSSSSSDSDPAAHLENASSSASSSSAAKGKGKEPAGFAYNPGQRNLVHVQKREKFWQLWRPRELPAPPRASMEDAELIPLEHAGVLSQMTFTWAGPIMILGYERALEATDLWKLGKDRQARELSTRLLERWDRRVQAAKAHNASLESGELQPGAMLKLRWAAASALGKGPKGGVRERERLWRLPPPAEPKGASQRAAAAKATAKGAKKPVNWSGHQQPSLASAVIDLFRREMAAAIVIKLVADSAQMLSPLLIRVIVQFAAEAYVHYINPAIPGPNVGVGVGYAIALFAMQLLNSVAQHAFFFRSMSMGVDARTAVISAMYTRALSLNAKDRSPGALLNHASTDVSRIDFAMQWALLMFTSPFALALCLGLLIWQIGVSALAGFAILVVAIPAQGWVMKSLFMTRRESMKFTDKRAKLINELLSSIQIVKSFAFERKFLEKIGAIRRKELQGIRKLIIVRSAMIALAFSLPTLASVVGFLVYAALGNSLLEGGANTTSRVFIALTLFQLLRMPLMFLPLSFSSAADAYAAISRLSNVFTAELLEDKSERAPEAKFSLELIDACFKYDEVDPSKDDEKKKKHKKGHAKDTHAAKPVVAAEQGNAKPPSFMQRLFKPKQSIAVAPSSETGLPKPVTANKAAETELTDAPEEFDEKHEPAEEVPFSLRNINLRFTPGELVAIVGPVGSGKTSIFSGLTGEMRMESGRIIWGGNGLAAYSAQQPWIQAASVRDNITFGLAFEEERYWEVVKTCELEADLRMLPQGDMTEIGEKGTTLSGGQKARVNLARALYFDAEIYMLDDPLSAVDPHVGKALFQNLILGLRARGKTVLLVTHAIHVLPQCDRIITLVDGHVAEDGRYETLVHAGGPFQKLVQDFGGDAQEEEEEHKEDEEEAIDEAAAALRHDKKTTARAAMTDADGTKAMQTQEERNTGSIALSVYKAYFHAGRGWIMVPLVLIGLVLMQGAVVMGSYTLRWWLSDDLAWTQGQYMGLYAGLGVATAFFTGLMGISTGMFSYYAAAEIHRQSITRVLYAPLSFFNVTPKGRIANRFSKDADSLDNQLADSFRMAASTIAQVIGACILISILAHYFAPAVAGILVFYFIGAAIYRRSAREVKRIDGTLRGSLYAHISETLHGVSTVKAYGETQRFLRDHFRLMDYENRAYFMTITNQRWLGIRLDFLGALLVFIVALLTTAGASQGISPASTGLALSYILQVSQSFSWMTRQIAEVENEMSSVERLNHYATEIDEEAPQEIPDAHLPAEWPQAGAIAIRDVQLRYRPELPIVLKGISLDVKAGQKVGIVGRTGSGKSTLLTALLRLVELEAGSIVIDGVDVSKIGLRDLRQRIAILPQDPTLFSGTLRSNLDPFGQYDDARLWDALRRAHLVDNDSAGATPAHGGTPVPSGRATPTGIEPDAADETKVSRFTLDTTIEEEGNNLSLGQRSLVSLARALVKDSRVILHDEATASVDVETDAKIQTTLNEAFGDRTLLCIAHRLRTILNYDLVCVVDSGRVAEYASPLELFDQGGIFHEMAERANISRADIQLASTRGL